METGQQKRVIIDKIKPLISLKEFDSHANDSPSLVSLACRLRKFSSCPQIGNYLDRLHSDYDDDFATAVSNFYSL